MGFVLEAIGRVRGGRSTPADDNWGMSHARIELDESRFTPMALAGLQDFSHAEVIFLFDKVAQGEIETGARHPRGRADWPAVGIFAQRGKCRPNRLGASVVRIVSVDGTGVTVEGLDAIDGTPILDIKPVMKGFLPRGEVIEPAWAAEIMKDYW
ncbi:MAG TPA: SAM-dependent methyltransferase [Caulobacteraceae bacterium]